MPAPTSRGGKQETHTLSTSHSEMVSLKPILLAAAAVCVFAEPQGLSHTLSTEYQFNKAPPPPSRRNAFRGVYTMPQEPVPQYLAYDGSPVVAQPSKGAWMNKETGPISRMEEQGDSMGSYEKDLAQIMNHNHYLALILDSPAKMPEGPNSRESVTPESPGIQVPPAVPVVSPAVVRPQQNKKKTIQSGSGNDPRINFALTPLDNGYFDRNQNQKNEPVAKQVDGQHEGGGSTPVGLPQRQIRQNPNLSKTKNLVANQLDRLKTGLSHDGSVSTEKPRSIMMQEPETEDPAKPIYSIAVIAAVAAALAVAILGFAYGWYNMSKRAKATADVDYPAYGVTGPTVDMTGDRKLAHSAHMYHYQHQKQQIIAMDRNGLEQRNGSISDPESEEENEEGDYTVYECPGFATTGDMEVKNPLFTENPTPATPGKCDLVKPQP